jgi:hypothetical protein
MDIGVEKNMAKVIPIDERKQPPTKVADSISYLLRQKQATAPCPHILLVGQHPKALLLRYAGLASKGYEMMASTIPTATELLRANSIDLVVLLEKPNPDSLELMKRFALPGVKVLALDVGILPRQMLSEVRLLLG